MDIVCYFFIKGEYMADLLFNITQNVVLGENILLTSSKYIQECGTRFILVMDPDLKTSMNGSSAGSLIKEKILQPLSERDIDYFIYDNLSDTVQTRDIEAALKLARQGRIDGVIALGLTAALSAGRLIASLYNDNKGIYDYIDDKSVIDSNPLPLICIPSTMRAPYIFTQYTPVTDSRTRKMKLVKAVKNPCKVVIWDSMLASLLPQNKKPSIIIDIFSLALEGAISQKASFFTDIFSSNALKLLAEVIKSKEGSSKTRECLLLTQAGFLASLATSISSIGVASLLGLTINARVSVNRGEISTILLPYILKEAVSYKESKIKEIATIMQEEDAEGLVKSIKEYIVKNALPARFSSLSMEQDKLALAIEDALELEAINTLPREETHDTLYDLIKKAF